MAVLVHFGLIRNDFAGFVAGTVIRTHYENRAFAAFLKISAYKNVAIRQQMKG
jgi:hypothetical protein